MLKKTAYLLLFLCFSTSIALGQTTYLPLNTEVYHLLDRLETKSGALSMDLFSGTKPVSRKGAVNFMQQFLTDSLSMNLTTRDEYNLDQNIALSGEWAADTNGAKDSRYPILKHFYKKQSDFIYVKTNNFFLSVNPVISVQAGYDKASDFKGKRLSSSRGFEIRGHISKKIGFYTFFTDNQEQPPHYVKKWIDYHQAIPGADYYKDKPTYYDYMLAKGYIDFAAVKDVVNITFGYDKHFYGDGIRSLLLSDFAANYTFLRLNTRIWKLNYQNLFMELVPNYQRTLRTGGGDLRYPHKYAAIHQLSMNLTRWLNVAIFESVVFGGRDRFEFSYMIPLIFYRSAQRQLGDPDNGNLGLSFKAVAAKKFQFYGQFLLDDLQTKYVFKRNGYWANKFGVQLGAKYFDALHIRNLDLQAELNVVRPYTYSHYDSTANYSHYNQPLAHPLGANFAELIVAANYQPANNMYLSLKAIYYQKGVDTGSANYGGDIFKNYYEATPLTANPADMYLYHTIASGVKVNAMLVNFNASYEFKRNYFLDIGFTTRRLTYKTLPLPAETSNFIYLGLRANIARRDYAMF